MGSKRQNNQLELAFGEAVRSEAPNRLARGTEDPMARPAVEGSAALPEVTGGLMEVIVARDNLKKALAQVKRNKGAPGIDGMTVEELTPYLKEHWPAIRAQLLDGAYRPQPVRRVEIPKPAGPLGASGGGPRTTIDCRGAVLGGGHRPGEVLRPGQPRPLDGAGGQAG